MANCGLYVTHIALQAPLDDTIDLFNQYGVVIEIVPLIKNEKYRTAIIEMLSENMALQAAKNLHKNEFYGQRLKVKRSKQGALWRQDCNLASFEIDLFVLNTLDTLGETYSSTANVIRYILACNGREFINELIRQSIEIERSGGLLTFDKSRKRTLGGIFFYLSKGYKIKRTLEAA